VPLPALYSPFFVNRPSGIQSLGEYVGGGGGGAAVLLGNQLHCELLLNSAYDFDTSSRTELWSVECNTLFSSANVPNVTDLVNFPEDVCLNGDAPYSCATTYNFEAHPPNRTLRGMGFVVANDAVSSSHLLSGFTILAVYSIIYTIGSVLRSAVTGSSHRVVMSDMHDPTVVVDMLLAIYMIRSRCASNRARKAQPTSSSSDIEPTLAMEKLMFDELVTFLRSPERVLKLTGKPRKTPPLQDVTSAST
jgi:hypothetical protein